MIGGKNHVVILIKITFGSEFLATKTKYFGNCTTSKWKFKRSNPNNCWNLQITFRDHSFYSLTFVQFLARFSEFFFAVFWNFHYLGNKRTVKSDSMASPNDLPTFFVWYSIIYLVGYRRSKNCMKATPFLNHIVIKILNLILIMCLTKLFRW